MACLLSLLAATLSRPGHHVCTHIQRALPLSPSLFLSSSLTPSHSLFLTLFHTTTLSHITHHSHTSHAGKYLLVKDPNKDLLRLYAVPEDAFETNYTEEPLAEADEQVPADNSSAVPSSGAAGAAGEEGGDE